MLASTRPWIGIGMPVGCAPCKKHRRVIASFIVDHRNVSFADDIGWLQIYRNVTS
jgi:hypothetical protein